MTKLRVGDLFVIPTGDGRAGVGQVVGTYRADAYYFAIFDSVNPLDEALEASAQAAAMTPVLFLALSMDAKLHAGHWTIAGHAPVRPSIPLPAYKEVVGSAEHIEVVDHAGARRRPATPIEAAALKNRKIVAPVRLERALRASLGLGPWIDAYDELRPGGGVTSAEIFG